MRAVSVSHRIRTVVVGAASALFLVGALPASVQAQTVTAQNVSAFLANPGSLLTTYPNGGSDFAAAVRNLALADASTIPAIIALLSSANPAQQSAIGSGLGQAVQSVAQSNPALATDIQSQLAASGVQNAIVAYSTVTGNVTTAAGGPGGGGAGGGGGVGGPVNTTIPGSGSGGGGGSSFTGTAGGTGNGGTITGGTGGSVPSSGGTAISASVSRS